MEIFNDISNFNNTSDYLPILNGTLNSVLLLIFFVFHNVLSSPYLKNWYKNFNLSSIIENVMTLMLIIILTRYCYKWVFNEWNIISFTFIAIIVIIIYDILFCVTISVIPKGYSYIVDFFKKNKKQLDFKTILINICMIITICLLSSYFATLDNNINIITLISTLFFIPYLLYIE